jgi:L-amino acid N-acyltransferase YncA
MDLKIRNVTLDDTAELASILNEIIEDGRYSVLDTPFTFEEEHAYISGFHKRGIFLVAEADNQIVGMQTIEPLATYTHAMDHVGQIGTFLKLNYIGKGIGTKLSEISFKRAKELGYEKIFTFVREDNENSLRFHLKLGFQIVGVAKRHSKIKGKYLDEILIEKFL